MMMILKRKEVLIGSLIMLILTAAFINYNYSALPQSIDGEMTSVSQTVTDENADAQETARKMGEAQYVSSNANDESDYFVQARMNRENARSKSIEMLNEIINNPNMDAQSKQKAQEEILSSATATDKEAVCENLIQAKGFAQCVVFISGEEANVTVKSDGLTGADLAKIQEIVSSQTEILIKNIKIVEVK